MRKFTNKWQVESEQVKSAIIQEKTDCNRREDNMSNKIVRFEDIIAWQKARELTNLVYHELRYNKDYSFRDQIRRAVISVMNNIAEGYERKSNNEFRQFLYVAKGSCGEVRSMLYVADDERYITKEEFNELYDKATIISKMLAKLITSMKP